MPIIRKALRNREKRTDQINLQGPVALTSGGLFTQYMNDTDPANRATSVSTAYRCAAILSGSIAGAPKCVENIRTGKQQPNSIGTQLINNPHPRMDAYVWWENMVMNMLFKGDAMFLKMRDPASGKIAYLAPLDPEKMKVKAVEDAKGVWVDTLYLYRLKDGQEVPLLAEDVFHVPGLGFDGLRGMSVVQACKRVFENAMSADQLAHRFYTNGTLAAGILTTDKRLEEKQAEALKQRWQKKAAGVQNAHDIVVLDQGATFQQVQMSMADAQFMEARKFNIGEVARIFGVPLGLLSEAGEKPQTAEEVSLNFTLFTLNDWTSRISSAASRQILPTAQQLVFKTSGLIQPDMRTRSSAALMYRQTNIKTINELRAEEGLAPLDDSRADDPFFAGPAPTVGAAVPGTNQGKPEQPVPAGNAPKADYQS